MEDDDSRRAGSAFAPDAVSELLSHYRRRRLALHLLEHGQPLTLPDAAEAVAVDEHESAIDEIVPEDVKEIYVTLYHNHVPRLAEYGVVTYHQERDLVVPEDRLDALEPHLELGNRDP